MVRKITIENEDLCMKNTVHIANFISDLIFKVISRTYKYKELIKSGIIKPFDRNAVKTTVKRETIERAKINIEVDKDNIVPLSLTFFNDIEDKLPDLGIPKLNVNDLHARVAVYEDIYSLYYKPRDIFVFVDKYMATYKIRHYDQYYPNVYHNFMIFDNDQIDLSNNNIEKLAIIKFKKKIDKLHIFVLNDNNQKFVKYSLIALPIDFNIYYDSSDIKRMIYMTSIVDPFNKFIFGLNSYSINHLLEIDNLSEITVYLNRYVKNENRIADIIFEFKADNVISKSTNTNNTSIVNYIKVNGNTVIVNVVNYIPLNRLPSNHFFNFLNFYIHPAVKIERLSFNLCPICILRMSKNDDILNSLSKPCIREKIDRCMYTYVVTDDKSLQSIKSKIIRKFNTLEGKWKYLEKILDSMNILLEDILKNTIFRAAEIFPNDERMLSSVGNPYAYASDVFVMLVYHMLRVTSKTTKITDENGNVLGKLTMLYPIIYLPDL